MRQGESETDAHGKRIAHGTQIQIRLPLGEMSPFDSLAAQRSDDELIGHQRRKPFETVVANHRVRPSVNNKTSGCFSAFIICTASLILCSSSPPEKRYRLARSGKISLKPVSGDEVDFRRAKLQLNLRQVFDRHFW